MKKNVKFLLTKQFLIVVIQIISFDIFIQTKCSIDQSLISIRADFNCSTFNTTNCSTCKPGSYFDISEFKQKCQLTYYCLLI